MLIPRSLRIDGSATFTTVLSSMIMNNPTETAARVHHFRFSSVKSRDLTTGRLENLVPFARGRLRLDADRRPGGNRELDAPRAAARSRALPRPPSHLDRRAGTVLAGAGRGSRDRVLGAVDGSRRRLGRARMGEVVRRREAESR